MWSILALGAIERVIHHWIELDSLTRIQLNQLQGKMLRVVIASPQLSVDICFDEDEVRLEPTITGHPEQSSVFEQRPFDPEHAFSEATATLKVENIVELAKLFLAEEIGNIPVQGDYRLLQELQRIIQQAEPDLAAHLSPWIGPALAHELGKLQLAPKILKRSMQSHFFFAEDALKEDSGLFAGRWEMDELHHSTRQLNQNIDRLEAHLQQLQAQLLSQSVQKQD
ncbi:ubiquinone biosynthesis accessory factor UbiJ [Acinetobacter radioresistens]|uniref:ubiquinone biosynthesis accessory factor UbiJ n=1 Tax=Acinetobacter radioresistens TaxID=40216 RepID=UPI000E707321|nr:hypothetical protein [Acinetobacter radioresistens]RJL74686.1 hypothetical protein D5055_01420 [Acinetobacter radioresistens]